MASLLLNRSIESEYGFVEENLVILLATLKTKAHEFLVDTQLSILVPTGHAAQRKYAGVVSDAIHNLRRAKSERSTSFLIRLDV